MEVFLSLAFWLKLVEYVGVPAVFIFLIFILRKSDDARYDKQEAARKAEREALEAAREKERAALEKARETDRHEHVAKWESMISEHQDERNRHAKETDRLMIILERQTSAIELQSNLTARMNDKIDTNQFCPLVKEKTHG